MRWRALVIVLAASWIAFSPSQAQVSPAGGRSLVLDGQEAFVAGDHRAFDTDLMRAYTLEA